MIHAAVYFMPHLSMATGGTALLDMLVTPTLGDIAWPRVAVLLILAIGIAAFSCAVDPE